MPVPAANRVWVSLADAEATAVARMAASRGTRPSELARTALLAFLGQPAEPPPAKNAVAVAPVLARLEALAEALGRHVADFGRLVPNTEDTLAERDAVRASLQDIAKAIGVMAGSLEPDDGGVTAFGPDR